MLGPVLGFLGTLLGLWIGHRRWNTDREDIDGKDYKSNLRSAYLELWDVVEDAHLKMRQSLDDGLSPEVFSGFLADVNSFMISKGLFIERGDRILVLSYLFAQNEYLALASSSPQGQAAAVITMEFPPNMPGNLSALAELERKVQALRDELRARIRSVLGAPESSAWSAHVRPSEELLSEMRSLTAEVVKRAEAP